MTRARQPLRIIGWREWLALPDLAVHALKAKIDTGARSSTLHAFDVQTFARDGRRWVRFKVHPVQRSTRETVHAELPLHDERLIRDSGGKEQLRPVILTTIEVSGERWPIELTLTNRDAMGFRMLLGRQAIRGRFVVDAGRSYVTGRRNGLGKLAAKKDARKGAQP
ncbi:MAG: ATP-dependent zinc protease [Actinobacteria bacterium]|nr:ATP-dependent zinc protease [Actinomycetota bacterium]